MPLSSRIAAAARTVADRAAHALGYAPAVPGTRGPVSAMPMPRDAEHAAILRTREAMTGRTTYYLGPTPSYIQTYPGSGLTPAQIHSIHNEVRTAGWMLRKADLDEQVKKRDAHLACVGRSDRAAVSGKPHFVRPFDASPLAAEVAKYVQAVVDGIESFSKAQYEILAANADGFAIQEIVWKERRVRFAGKAIGGLHPQQLTTVHNKHVRFDVEHDRPMLDFGTGKFVPLHEFPHKFIYHVGVGDGPARTRGYMYQCIWLHLIKHNAIARWAVVLEIWGIPVPYGKVDHALWQDDTRKSALTALLRDFGLGKPSIFTDEIDILTSPTVAAGDARGMHAALVGWAETEMSKAVLLQTLTTELGGVGSYKASETHEATMELGVRMNAAALQDTNRDQLFRAIVERAVYDFDDETGRPVGVRRDGLCPLLGADPEDVMGAIPRSFYRIDREMSPTARSDIYKSAVNDLRLKIDPEQYADEFGLNLVTDPAKAIQGEAEVLGEGERVAGVIGSDGKPAATPQAQQPSATGGLELTATAQGAIITVNEARAHMGLPPISGGEVTISEYVARMESAAPQPPPTGKGPA